jgi:hypothetical protein
VFMQTAMVRTCEGVASIEMQGQGCLGAHGLSTMPMLSSCKRDRASWAATNASPLLPRHFVGLYLLQIFPSMLCTETMQGLIAWNTDPHAPGPSAKSEGTLQAAGSPYAHASLHRYLLPEIIPVGLLESNIIADVGQYQVLAVDDSRLSSSLSSNHLSCSISLTEC